MCGIGGHFGRPRGADLRARMLAALASRGPDAQHVAAFATDGTRLPDDAPAAAGLVHARLSIIDPRPEADQPMGSADGMVWISYNGEVHGWGEAARELTAAGGPFRTRADTEFILRGYEAWGIDGLLPRLTGMFAFALVDFRARRVHVVRDRMGEKPVVYAHSGDGFAFGSTVRSVLPWLPRDRRGFSPEAIDAYLAHRYVPAPRTIFAHVARLPNAHRLEYDLDRGTLAVHRYWAPRPVAAADARALFDDAIALRLVADRPLGVFLSGGIDSGTIACRVAATGHRSLSTFSAAFPGSALDESAEAAATAAALGLPNERIVVPTAVGADFARIVAALDEPFADPSAFPTWYLARATERHVKVVLGGDGGDELFGGYKRIAKHLRNAWRGTLTVPLPALPDARPKGWRKALSELALDWESAYALRKSDLMTMAHGLEARAPFLDHRFVEAVLALPPRERFTAPPKRYLAALAPDLERLGAFVRKKRGFNPPVGDWLAGDLADRLPAVAAALGALTGGQLDAARVAAMVAAYAATPALAEQVLSLAILAESLAQLAREAADGG